MFGGFIPQISKHRRHFQRADSTFAASVAPMTFVEQLDGLCRRCSKDALNAGTAGAAQTWTSAGVFPSWDQTRVPPRCRPRAVFTCRAATLL